MKVYCIENQLNGKKYVGITKGEIIRRFKKHKEIAKYNQNKQHLHKAMLKDGINNFIVYQIDEASNVDELFKKEKYWIKKLNTKIGGYNETDGGEGTYGHKQSDETKNKISQKRKGVLLTESHKLAIKESMIGQNKGKNNPFYGKTHKKETIEKYLKHKSKCIFCGIETTNANIKRWHNDNCKKK